MSDGALLFAIVPISVMVEEGEGGSWRRNSLLAHHTLRGVVSFPDELFYPIANQTVGLIVERGRPHDHAQAVFWTRIVDDGFRKSKGKRLPVKAGPNDLDRVLPPLQRFLLEPDVPVESIPGFVKAAPIDMADPILELTPEAYVDSPIPDLAPLMERLDRQVRDDVASLVEIDLRAGSAGRTIVDAARNGKPTPTVAKPSTLPGFGLFPLEELFSLTAGDYHSMANVPAGPTPIATCADGGNGIMGFYEIEPPHIYRDALTIAFNGKPLTTKLHPYQFAAKDDVAVAIPRADVDAKLSIEALIFIQAALNSERWRFSYYRKCFFKKLGRTTIELPVRADGAPDVDFMERAVRAQPYWWFLAPRLADWAPQSPPA
jgi:type I restriction enzyme M protein